MPCRRVWAWPRWRSWGSTWSPSTDPHQPPAIEHSQRSSRRRPGPRSITSAMNTSCGLTRRPFRTGAVFSSTGKVGMRSSSSRTARPLGVTHLTLFEWLLGQLATWPAGLGADGSVHTIIRRKKDAWGKCPTVSEGGRGARGTGSPDPSMISNPPAARLAPAEFQQVGDRAGAEGGAREGHRLPPKESDQTLSGLMVEDTLPHRLG